MMGLPTEFSAGVTLVVLKITRPDMSVVGVIWNVNPRSPLIRSWLRVVCEQFNESINNDYWNINNFITRESNTQTISKYLNLIKYMGIK
jgi:hypothetical protein